MARTAIGLGHEYMVLTDHSPRLTIAHGLSRERLEQQLADVAVLNERLAPFRILTGIEVDILEDGLLDHGDDVLARLDIVVASVHSKLRMDGKEMTERMVRADRRPERRHPRALHRADDRPASGEQRSTPTTCSPRAPSSTPRSRSTAVPSGSIRRGGCSQLAIDYGCWFSIDTDAHATGQLEWQAHGCDRAAECDVPLDRVINTWSADELLQWAAAELTDSVAGHVEEDQEEEGEDAPVEGQPRQAAEHGAWLTTWSPRHRPPGEATTTTSTTA